MPLCGGTSTRMGINKAGGGNVLELVTRFGAVCLYSVNLFDASEEDTTSRRTAYNIQIQQRVSKVFDRLAILLAKRSSQG